jgi:16S rRNA processing protein RimM
MSPVRSGQNASEPEADDLLAIARLGRAHGVRGEIRAESLCPPVLSFQDLVIEGPLWLRSRKRPLRSVEVAGLRPHREVWLLTLDGIGDREAAEELNGDEICMERGELPDLPEGWYWEADLVGLVVEDVQRGVIGTAAGLEQLGAQNVLVVEKRPPGEDPVHIPWVEALVREIDLDARRIRVDLPAEYPGLS